MGCGTELKEQDAVLFPGAAVISFHPDPAPAGDRL
jgi:hypothetical protein